MEEVEEIGSVLISAIAELLKTGDVLKCLRFEVELRARERGLLLR